MKKYILSLATVAALAVSGGCDFLDRPQKSAMDDSNFWTNESNVRLFVNGGYANYFVGYNSGWGTTYAPLRGYTFSDDLVSANKQSAFQAAVPADNWYRAEGTYWLQQQGASPWNFAWVRKWNLLIDRLDQMKENGYLTEEAYNHWMGVARFFRGYEYSMLVQSFGDVPYYDKVLADNDLDGQYKDRDPREMVMDKVYEDFDFALNNIRVSDGSNYLNRYIAAGFISRFMLFEGTWYTYHDEDTFLERDARAKKYLEMAVKAGDLVIGSGNYAFDTDFRTLFGSFGFLNSKEVLMYREYSDALAVRHAVASYSNLTESQAPAPNLALLKSFICNDGKTYSESTAPNAESFDLKDLVKSRDPRFEATFWDEANNASASLLYACKFIDRKGPTYYGGTYPAEYGSVTNINGYPVMRYAEVVLNWIEAKAVLAENYGGAAVTQTDLDASINAIRKRPLDQTAIEKGVKQTADLKLASLPNDPDRDADVSQLMWEIRRERRMEFVYEFARIMDIRRWKKLHYMDGDQNPDLLVGCWVDFNHTNDADRLVKFNWLESSQEGQFSVRKADGTVVTYNGSNAADMVGFYIPRNVQNRDKFTDRNYLAPICTDVINTYVDKGYTITQNPGW